MLTLDTVDKRIRARLEGFAETQPTWVVNYEERPTLDQVGKQGSMNNSEDVILVAEPSPLTVQERIISSIDFHNIDAVAHTITVEQTNDSGTLITLRVSELQVDEHLIYSEDGLWRIYDARGDVKVPTGLTVEKTLGQLRPGNDSTFLIYSPPANGRAICLNITVCNTSSSPATFRIFKDPTGTIWDERTALAYDLTIAAKTTIIMEGRWPISNPTGSFAVRSSVGNALTFTLDGEETVD